MVPNHNKGNPNKPPLLPLGSEPPKTSFFSLSSLPVFIYFILTPYIYAWNLVIQEQMTFFAPLWYPFPPISPKHFLPAFPHVTFYLLLHTSLYSVILSGYFIGLPKHFFEHLIFPVGSPYRLLFSLAFSRISFPSRVRRNSVVLPQENPRFPKRFLRTTKSQTFPAHSRSILFFGGFLLTLMVISRFTAW